MAEVEATMEVEVEQEQEQEAPAARPRRERKSKVNSSALADLASARRGGSKRNEQFQLGESKSVFKTVDEDEYADMVSKRRQDDFVENDGDDLGYKDDGEEAWNRAESSGDEYEEKKGAAKKYGMVNTKEAVKAKPASQNRISMMLQKQAQAKKAQAPIAEAGIGGLQEAESLPAKRSKPDVVVDMDDLLGGLDASSTKPKAKKVAKKQGSGGPSGARKGEFFSPQSKKAPAVIQRKKIVPVKQEAEEEEEMHVPDAGDDYDDVPADEMEEEAAPAQNGGFAPAPASEKASAGLMTIKAEDDWKSWRNDAMKVEEEEEEGRHD
mmetsp:Transcript_46006/g.109278  ORF Transcript_46006/g.109278 Transcript_46006/m.109278 type:complete len:323 (-) Transcript_46006:115-1083(-)